MPNRRRNLYWSIETDKKAVDLAWKNKQSVSAYLAEIVVREAKKLSLDISDARS